MYVCWGEQKDPLEDSVKEWEMRSVSKLIWLSPALTLSVGAQSKLLRFNLVWGFSR